jgi:spermidine synthase
MKLARVRLIICCFILAFCSLSYEFLLAQSMSIMGGHTVLNYCLTIGVFICALGLGSLVRTQQYGSHETMVRLFQLELLLAFLGGMAPLVIIGLSQDGGSLGTWLGNGALVLAIGFASGMELPLLLRLAEAEGLKDMVIKLLAFDYIASFLGALSFPLWLFPTWGIVQSSLILATLNILGAMLLLPRERTFPFAALGGMSLLVLILAFRQSEAIQHWLAQVVILSERVT